MAAHLFIHSGLPAQTILLKEAEPLIAGRAADCGLVLNNVEVSRRHCKFRWDGQKCIVEDLSSRRGIRVNGDPVVEQAELQPGDRIAIGPIVLEFGVGSAPEAAAGGGSSAAPCEIPMLVHGESTERVAPSTPGEELVIGRDPQGDVVLNHPGVSRRHAILRALPSGSCEITDLHSTGGTFVNGRRFDSHELTVGDKLQIGPFDFQYDGQALVRIAGVCGSSIQVVKIGQRESKRLLLNDLSFTIAASRFTGILGPSGAGKSTLLHTLAGLQPPEEGRVFVDGHDIYARREPHTFGLVPQEDIVHRELRVSDALRFSARLRLPAATPRIEIQKLILQTMDQLGLRAYCTQPIAELSGGQRKRVSVAVELLAKPGVLFLDEPSSGLDPATEFQLMEVLRELTNTGCTVVCTTHVMENAYLMDELLIITGGCLAFVGTPQEAREYFGVTRLPALYERLLERPCGEWQKEFAARQHVAEPKAPAPANNFRSRRARRAFAVPILLRRQWAILASDWRNFAILGIPPLVIAGLVAWVTNDQSLALFFAYLATLWFGCSNAAQAIVKEIPIYRRERLVGISAHAYLASKLLFLFAITAAQSLLLYGGLRLGMSALDGAPEFQVAALLGTALAAVGIGSAISAFARSEMQAVLIVPLILIPQILLSGNPVPAWKMKLPVYIAAWPMPTFAAQTLMDASFFWEQRIDGQMVEEHRDAMTNLHREVPLKNGEAFVDPIPGELALGTFAAWSMATYAIAWFGLRRQERK